MEQNDIKKFEKLLENLKKLPDMTPREVNIFNVGSRGYYENPTTDLLAFFCDDSAAHGLGSLVLASLIDCLPSHFQSIDKSLTNPPMREAKTDCGRIDLVLESEQWVMILENKIFHQQNNPFDDYEQWGIENYATRQKIFVILSPYGGEDRNNWEAITYKDFITAIKVRLSDYFVEQPLNKWSVLLREFLLHLEGVMYKKSINDEAITFIFDNFSSIIELEKMKKNAINEYHQKLQKALYDKLKEGVGIHLHNWSGHPAMRFHLEKWKTYSDVVLYKLSEPNSGFGIKFYINIQDADNTQNADNYIDLSTCGEPWSEQSHKYRGYEVTKLASQSFDDIVSEIAKRLKEIDKYEQLM